MRCVVAAVSSICAEYDFFTGGAQPSTTKLAKIVLYHVPAFSRYCHQTTGYATSAGHIAVTSYTALNLAVNAHRITSLGAPGLTFLVIGTRFMPLLYSLAPFFSLNFHKLLILCYEVYRDCGLGNDVYGRLEHLFNKRLI